ncbi:MAG TPA: hypothetical protein VL651_10075 [Bacteroidia bacterium]|jgi:hypothetical protein|nr:hypothetical protein [Bacteroidia bacterium]
MKRLYFLTLCSTVLAACIFFFKKREATTIPTGDGLVIPKEWLAANKGPVTPTKDCRPGDQTFLTYPEWFLVFSPQEQADYFKTHTATSFPFMSHVSQMWEGYRIVNDQIKGNFPVNSGYQWMIRVINSSSTVEYSIKAWYETIVGRITDTGIPLTDEDKFDAAFTSDYADFIRDRPWYEFDFKSQLEKLWSSTSFFGDHFFRKLERKYMLTSELIVKYIYGKIIGMGTKEVYDEALPTTVAIMDNGQMEVLPRYDKFGAAALGLAQKGLNFEEIAGNTSAILISVIVPSNANEDLGKAKIVFTQPVSSAPEKKRVVLAVPVHDLSELLLEFDRKKMKAEHVFDY